MLIQDSESDKAKVFAEVANSVDDYVFGASSNDDVLSEFGAEDGAVILFKKVHSLALFAYYN